MSGSVYSMPVASAEGVSTSIKQSTSVGNCHARMHTPYIQQISSTQNSDFHPLCKVEQLQNMMAKELDGMKCQHRDLLDVLFPEGMLGKLNLKLEDLNLDSTAPGKWTETAIAVVFNSISMKTYMTTLGR